MYHILKMETYCVREKKKTKCVPGSDEIIKAKGNGRLMLRCICASCGITKHSFIKTNKKGGLLDLHAAIGKLPKPKGGFTLPSHKYTGPYNPLDKQLDSNDQPLPGQEPYNQIDAIAIKHDICYRDNDNKKGKLKCDKDMLDSLSQTKTKGIRESFDKKLVQAAIGTKYKLGLGAKNGKRRRGKQN